jgi:hypothetical protein
MDRGTRARAAALGGLSRLVLVSTALFWTILIAMLLDLSLNTVDVPREPDEHAEGAQGR